MALTPPMSLRLVLRGPVVHTACHTTLSLQPCGNGDLFLPQRATTDFSHYRGSHAATVTAPAAWGGSAKLCFPVHQMITITLKGSSTELDKIFEHNAHLESHLENIFHSVQTRLVLTYLSSEFVFINCL